MTAVVMCPNEAAKLGFNVPPTTALAATCLCGMALMQEGRPGGWDLSGAGKAGFMVMPGFRDPSFAVPKRARFCADASSAIGPRDRFSPVRQEPGRMATAETPSCNPIEAGFPTGCPPPLDAWRPCSADSCTDLATAASASNTFGDAFGINCGDTFGNDFSTGHAVVGTIVGQNVGPATGAAW